MGVRFRRCGGVPGRNIGVSGSARRMNCRAVNGEPFVEGVDFSDRGLFPEGLDIENDGRCPRAFGSGVRGGSGGESPTSGASDNVAALIHRSSLAAD